MKLISSIVLVGFLLGASQSEAMDKEEIHEEFGKDGLVTELTRLAESIEANHHNPQRQKSLIKEFDALKKQIKDEASDKAQKKARVGGSSAKK